MTQAPAHASVVLRVYNDNIENLVTNDDFDAGTCTQHTSDQLLRSMLVNDSGVSLANGGTGVAAPDALILQQVRGSSQIQAIADQLDVVFGLPAGTYQSFAAWTDPETWGVDHHCSDPAKADRKKKQTNGIIYNTQTLSLLSTSAYWSVGWYPGSGAYPGSCVMYKPPNADPGTTDAAKWKRTSAIMGRFQYISTGTTVGIATMHLPENNMDHPCGTTSGDKGIGGSGIVFGSGANDKMLNSTVRIIGMDANRQGLSPAVLNSTYGVTSHGTARTKTKNYPGAATGGSKIDYLFTNTAVAPSPIDYTVQGTLSNHRATYAFMTW